MKQYWKRNIRTLLILLAVWFIVSFGFGILLVEPSMPLNWRVQIGLLVCPARLNIFIRDIDFVYVYRMNKLDEEFDVNENNPLK
ncbi:Sodium:solute symporter associated protein [Winogradskyella psychrotolerans RS-3]|uniref:Sodium:solute symporter associated protein n=1 Tax=Winogradskyella psychrotolerans RS-3 TaxID=641526 RepID=S7VVZ0_9FLAO|nr:Sodium:solute symporter associated protein [Winogradskyella psychrotolerans RS-3]